MHLQASVHIRRSPQDVWAYLGDVSNVAAWDRGVSRTEAPAATPPGVGFEFETFAHPRANSRQGDWGKMSYRITDIDPLRGCTIQLTSTDGNARYFKSAEWRFRVEAEHEGSRVFCSAVFTLRWQYLLLVPVFLMMKEAIRTDLEQLKTKLESSQARHKIRQSPVHREAVSGRPNRGQPNIHEPTSIQLQLQAPGYQPQTTSRPATPCATLSAISERHFRP